MYVRACVRAFVHACVRAYMCIVMGVPVCWYVHVCVRVVCVWGEHALVPNYPSPNFMISILFLLSITRNVSQVSIHILFTGSFGWYCITLVYMCVCLYACLAKTANVKRKASLSEKHNYCSVISIVQRRHLAINFHWRNLLAKFNNFLVQGLVN